MAEAVDQIDDTMSSETPAGTSGWWALLGNRLLLSLLAVSLFPMALMVLASQQWAGAAIKLAGLEIDV